VRHGKGDKERLVPLVGAAARALDDWLRVRRARPGGLFPAITRHHTIVGTGMTSHAVYNVLAKRQREAGVAKLSPHDFRRTFVGDLLDAGIDLATVQQLAKPASVTTTARYDRCGEATKRRMVEALHFPYRPGETDLRRLALSRAIFALRLSSTLALRCHARWRSAWENKWRLEFSLLGARSDMQKLRRRSRRQARGGSTQRHPCPTHWIKKGQSRAKRQGTSPG